MSHLHQGRVLSRRILTLKGQVARFLSALTAIAGAALLVAPVHGDTTWTNAGIVKNFWDFADNWSAGIPDAADVVTFPNPFPGTGTITLLSPGFADSLVLNDGYRLTTSSLTLTSGNVAVNDTDTTILEEPLFGPSGLTKTGIGNLNLQGANNYVGATTISQGAIDLSEASERIPDFSDVSIASGAQLRFFSGTAIETIDALSGVGSVVFGNPDAGGTDLRVGANNGGSTFSGSLTENFGGTGSLTKIGTGTLTLTGINSYTGGTTLSDGDLDVNVLSLPANGGVVNNSLLTFNQGFNGAYAGVISGSGAVAKTGTGTLTLNQTNSYSGGTVLSEGTLSVSHDDHLGADSGTVFFDGGTLRVDPATSINLSGDREFRVSTGANASFEIPNTRVRLFGGITGDGSFIKSGAGDLALQSTPSTYAGSTTISNGQLSVLTSSEMIPDQSHVTVDAPASVLIERGMGVFDGPVTETIGSLSGQGRIGFAGEGGHLRVGANNSSTTFAGDIFDFTGAGKLTKIGTGTLTLTGNNTYSAGTVISAGALQVTTSSLAATGGVENNSGLIFSQGTSGSYGGVISGSGVLIKRGAGDVRLTANNTFTGGIDLEAGVLEISEDNNLGDDSSPVNFLGGAFRVIGAGGINMDDDRAFVSVNGADIVLDNQTPSGFSVSGAISGAGGLVIDGMVGASVIVGNSATSYAGSTTVKAGAALVVSKNILGLDEVLPNTTDVTLNGAAASMVLAFGITETIDELDGLANTRVVFRSSTENHLILGGGNGSGTFAGQILAGAVDEDGRLTKVGAGTQALTGNNTYTGGTTVSGGTLSINTNSLPAAGGVVNDASLVFGQDFVGSYTGDISGTGSVSKTGAGVVSLTGASTYSGGTSVIAGTLLADTVDGGSSTGSGQVTVGFGATFGGVGVSSGTTVVQNGGTLAPGASTGRLFVRGVQLNAGSIFEVELAGDGGIPGLDFDQLDVLGAAVLGGDLTIDLLDSFLPGPLDMFEILESVALSGAFANAANGARLDTRGGEGSFLVSYDSASNSVVLSDFLAATLLGDSNRDGVVNTLDIDPFVLALTNPNQYAIDFPLVDFLGANDINQDGAVTTLDIDPFVVLITGQATAAPEPGSAVAACLLGGAFFLPRRATRVAWTVGRQKIRHL